jgi:hypothetical protein
MDATQGPTTNPFQYLLIPAAAAQPIAVQRYEGHSDTELRERLNNYFRRGPGLTDGQRSAMKQSIREQGEKHTKASGSADAAAPVVAPDSSLLDAAVDNLGGFEIVPVTLPCRANKFIGTSLYIDGTGRFKDLDLNSRASVLAGRDVRGDAFLLSNHDDPVQDAWERVDTTLETAEHLLGNPPNSTGADLSKMSSTQAAQSTADSRAVSADDAAAGLQALADGRAAFVAGDFAKAHEAFSRMLSFTDARTDLLANEDEVQRGRHSSYLNRAQCALKLGRWAEAEADSRAVLTKEPGNVKALYRGAMACINQNDFDAARDLHGRLRAAMGESAEATQLGTDLAAAERAHKAKERARYASMFVRTAADEERERREEAEQRQRAAERAQNEDLLEDEGAAGDEDEHGDGAPHMLQVVQN